MLLRSAPPAQAPPQPSSRRKRPAAMAADGYNSSKRRRKLWIDTDVGVDDAQALMLVLARPDVELVGVSAVHGNVAIAQVGRNIARVLALCGRGHVPLHLGANEPLVAPAMDASFFHGLDGLGDAPDAWPPSAEVDVQPQPGHAAIHLARTAQECEGELTVLAIGPLTNIALAAKIDESLPQRVAQLIVMGGAEATGNVTASAEYNAHCDAEAAHIVMRKFRQVVLVSWECTQRHELPAPWVERWLGKGTPKADFMRAIMEKSLAYERQRNPEAGWNACDALAAALAVCDDALLSAEPRHCVVELQGAHTRGMTVLQQPDGKKGLAANVLLVREVCMEKYKELLDAATD